MIYLTGCLFVEPYITIIVLRFHFLSKDSLYHLQYDYTSMMVRVVAPNSKPHTELILVGF